MLTTPSTAINKFESTLSFTSGGLYPQEHMDLNNQQICIQALDKAFPNSGKWWLYVTKY